MQLDYLAFIEQTTQRILAEKSKRLIDEYVASEEREVETARQTNDNKVIVRELMEQFKTMRKESAIQPMLKVVSSLPKEEMAAMAEALVEITSLKAYPASSGSTTYRPSPLNLERWMERLLRGAR